MADLTYSAAPYQILPHGAEASPADLEKTLQLERYYCAAPTVFSTGHRWLTTCTSLRATYGRALEDLEGARKDYPRANIVSCVLVFNPKITEQLDAYHEMVAEGELEAQGPRR